MIYTLTLNPAVDHTANFSHLTLGTVNRIQEESFYPGGKGINVSQILTTLGTSNTALGFVAGFTGAFLEEALRERDIQTDFIHLSNGTTRISLKVRTSREATEINGLGPIAKEGEIQQLFQRLDKLQQGDTLILAGSLAKGMKADFYEKVMHRLQRKGIRFVVDTSGEMLVNTLKYKPFLIKPNQHELGELFDVTLTNVEDVVDHGKKLQKQGAENVLVSLGKDGAVLLTGDGEVLQSNVPVGKLINSVGAGDSMVAGFISGFKETNDYRKSLKLGVACGSATAFSQGLAEKELIQRLEKEVEITSLQRK